MSNSIFSTIDYDRDHGMDQGIWPRFYLQILSLAEMAGGADLFHQKAELYEKEVIPEIKNLYDLHHQLQDAIADYKLGMEDGRYYKKDAHDTTILQTYHERNILNIFKNFIIRGKMLLVHFGKCEIIDENNFILDSFIHVKNQNNFDERKRQYLSSSDCRYLPIINLIDVARTSFLNEFTEHRGEVEHKIYKYGKFDLRVEDGKVIVIEPILMGFPLSQKVLFYYNSMLDLIEKILVYYYGINGERHLQGYALLEVNPNYDYTNQIYKYTFSMGGISWSENAEVCKYD